MQEALDQSFDRLLMMMILNYHDRYLTLDQLVEIRKQNAHEEGEVTEPEHMERTMTVLELAEGFGLTEAV